MRVASGVTRGGEEGEVLKYSGRKGSDKFQRRVSSPGRRDFIFADGIQGDFEPKRDVYGFNYGNLRLV